MRVRFILAFLVSAMLAACGEDPPPAPSPGPGPANIAPAFASATTASFNENATGTAYVALAIDANGDPVTYSLSGADAARFTVNSGTGAIAFLAPPDFELPDDADRNNVYQINVTASDGAAQTVLQVLVTVNDVGEPFVIRRRGTGFSQPVFVTGAGDGSGRLFVVERGGLIRILNPATGAINGTPFLDVTADVDITAGEDGLLGLAFAPDYALSGEIYIFIATSAGNVEIRKYTVSVADPDMINAGSEDLIFSFAHPSQNHFGGWIGFGADGFLYITSGDADAAVDAANPAQDNTSPLGKLFRIDVNGDDFPADTDRDYAIPAGNPFPAGGAELPEILANGLRNPFRASIDSLTGDLLIGDVGEDTREEIDLVPAGAVGPVLNFGWVRFEGTDVLVPAAAAPSAIPPVLQYDHGAGPFQGVSVTGGVVNRGPVLALRGHYIFGDYVSGNIWSIPVRDLMQGTTLSSTSLTRQTTAFAPDFGDMDNIVSFGTDDVGNVYVVDFIDGDIFRMENP